MARIALEANSAAILHLNENRAGVRTVQGANGVPRVPLVAHR